MLQSHNIESIMVEGGASVLTSFLASGLGDEVIVTVAPCFLLGGLEYGTTESKKRLGLHSVATYICGQDGDVVIAGSLQ
jgi:riboflavin biosynthesis pyrimidine reductase